MFERPVVAPMKVDENRQNFAEGKFRLASAVAMARLEQVPVIKQKSSISQNIAVSCSSLIGTLFC